MEQQRIALDARQLLVIVSHDFDARGAARGRSQRHDFLQHGVEADRAARQPPRAGEDEQVADDFRGAIGFAVDRLHLAAQLLGKRAGHAQQLQVPEDALQRVVQLVRDAGDELAERRQLFRLRQPLPQLLALGFELGLRRQIARDDDAADALAFGIEQVGHRHHERPVQHRDRRTRAWPARVVGPASARCASSASHAASSGPMNSASGRSSSCSRVRPTRVAKALLTCTIRPRRSKTATRCAIESNVFSSSRCDRITSSSSGRFSTAFDELASELVGAIEQVQLAARLDAHAFEDDGAERAAAAAQRDRHGDGRRVVDGQIPRPPRESRRARAASRRLPATADRRPAICTPLAACSGIGRGPQHERARAAIVDPDRRAIGAEQAVGAVAEACRAPRRAAASPTGSARTRRGAARRSRCSSSRWRRRDSSIAARNASAIGATSSRSEAGAAPLKPIASIPTRSSPRTSGSEQRRARVAGAPRDRACRGRRPSRRAGHPARNASATIAASSGAGVHGSVGSASRPKPEVACITPLRGLCSKSSEPAAARDVERVLVQRRQQVDEPRACAPAAKPGRRGAADAPGRLCRRLRRTDGSVASFGRLGHRCGSVGRACAELYAIGRRCATTRHREPSNQP